MLQNMFTRLQLASSSRRTTRPAEPGNTRAQTGGVPPPSIPDVFAAAPKPSTLRLAAAATAMQDALEVPYAAQPEQGSATKIPVVPLPRSTSEVYKLTSARDLRDAGYTIESARDVSKYPDFTLIVPNTTGHPTSWSPLRINRELTSQASRMLGSAFSSTMREDLNHEMVIHHPFEDAQRMTKVMSVVHRIDSVESLVPDDIEACKVAHLVDFLSPQNATDPILRDVLQACKQCISKDMPPDTALELWSLLLQDDPLAYKPVLVSYINNSDAAMQALAHTDHDTLVALLREPGMDRGEDDIVNVALNFWLLRTSPTVYPPKTWWNGFTL